MRVKPAILSLTLIGTVFANQTGIAYGNTSYQPNVLEVEGNDTYQKANEITLLPSYNSNDYYGVNFKGIFPDETDVDWVKVILPKERGDFKFKREYGNYIVNSELFVLKDGKLVPYQFEGKENPDAIYIKNSFLGIDEGLNQEYSVGLSFEANPIGSNPHEPNDYIVNGGKEVEFAEIPNKKLVSSNWTSKFDNFDNFAVQGTNKGTLSYEVHYSDAEYNYWTKWNKDYYLTYRLYAIENDGTVKLIKTDSQTGMKGKTFTSSLEVNNQDFSGKYILSLDNNYIEDPNYSVKISFDDKTVPEDTTPPGEISGLTENTTTSGATFSYTLPTNSDFSHLMVYRNNELVQNNVKTSTFNDSNLKPNTQYTYKFVSVDLTGNKSNGKEVIIKTKQMDTTAPSEITNLSYESSISKISFNYTFPIDEDFSHLRIYRNNELVRDNVREQFFTDMGLKPNTQYEYKFVSVDSNKNESSGITRTVTTKPEKSLEITQYSGVDRYDTNLIALNKIPDKSLSNVVIASGKNYPDALAGGVLNNKDVLGSALVLVSDNEKTINRAIVEIERLMKSDGKVYILGGESAVGSNIERLLKKEFSVERISGTDRVETSIKIANHVDPNPNEVFLANGFSFADPLSIVPVATQKKAPILLNDKKEYLSQKVKTYLTSKEVSKVTIVGGSGVVGKDVEKWLLDNGIAVERISGIDRYETSLKIAKKYYPNTTKVGVANGTVFPDALSGGTSAYINQMPIVLVGKSSMPSDTQTWIKETIKDQVILFGGKAVISDEIAKMIQ